MCHEARLFRFLGGNSAAFRWLIALILITTLVTGDAFSLAGSDEELVVVDCSGVPRVSSRAAVGESMRLTVENSTAIFPADLTLERNGTKLKPLIDGRIARFSPVDAGTWRLCDETGSGENFVRISFEPLQTGLSTQTGIVSALAIGGSIVGATAFGSSGGDNISSDSVATDGNAPLKPPSPAGGSSVNPAPIDPSKFPIGDPAAPLSPYE